MNKINSNQDFFTFLTNVATLSNFDGYKAGTLITVKFTGVKNPQTQGLTIEFGIESQTPELYSIDLKSDIPGVKIIAANSAGQISYNYFYTTPNNGYLLGNYYVNFILQNTIPKYGLIEITFPLNFNSSSFTVYDTNNIECYISGPITLIESCTISSLTINLKILEDLVVEAGTPSVTILIPKVYNFNTELDSGQITIRTIYDNVILDDSGDSETNRKATTGLDAPLMESTKNYNAFVYEPKTEGATAFYNVTIIPRNSFTSSAILQFVFPSIFPKGLGTGVGCSSKDLQVSEFDVIKCSVYDRILNITNIKEYNATNGTGFTISISGVVNPSIPNQAITSQIAFYIYKTDNFVSEYTYGLGVLQYTSAPPILYVANYVFKSNNTRVISDYGFSFKPSVSTSFSYFVIHMPHIFGLEELWDNKSYSLSLESGISVSNVVKNTIITIKSGSITSGNIFHMNLYEIFNPIVIGKSSFPSIFVYLQSSKEITMKTYSNLVQFETPYYFNNGSIVLIDNDSDEISIEAGYLFLYSFFLILNRTFSDYINVQFPDISTSQREIWPIFSKLTGVEVTPIICPAGSYNTNFRIGINRTFSTSSFIMRWVIADTKYIPIKALRINVKYNSSNFKIYTSIKLKRCKYLHCL